MSYVSQVCMLCADHCDCDSAMGQATIYVWIHGDCSLSSKHIANTDDKHAIHCGNEISIIEAMARLQCEFWPCNACCLVVCPAVRKRVLQNEQLVMYSNQPLNVVTKCLVAIGCVQVAL